MVYLDAIKVVRGVCDGVLGSSLFGQYQVLLFQCSGTVPASATAYPLCPRLVQVFPHFRLWSTGEHNEVTSPEYAQKFKKALMLIGDEDSHDGSEVTWL